VDKRLIVRGPREFRWQLLGGWRVTDPTPVSEVPLNYRYAFGGHYSLPDGDTLTNTLYYRDNPAGRGWLPSRADYKRVSSEVARYLKPDLNAVTRLPAPQLEDPDALVTSPFDRPAPAGFGSIAPWWEPRVSYQGTFDEHWKTQRLPYWPDLRMPPARSKFGSMPKKISTAVKPIPCMTTRPTAWAKIE